MVGRWRLAIREVWLVVTGSVIGGAVEAHVLGHIAGRHDVFGLALVLPPRDIFLSVGEGLEAVSEMARFAGGV